MKKILLLLVCFSFTFLTHAQNDFSPALQLVNKNSAAIGLSKDDINNLIVKDSYYDEISGAQLVYLQQTYKGLPVFNQLHVLAFKNGVLVSAAGGRINGIEKRSNGLSSSPSIRPEAAVATALTAKMIPTSESLVAVENLNGKYNFGKLGIAYENITAELVWLPLQNGKEVKLTWQVFLVPKQSSDYWMIRVDANTNQVIDENNLTVYCDWGNNKQHHHDGDCTTEIKNNSTFSREYFPFVQRRPFVQSPPLVGTANYLVIPYPAESPIHPGGTAALRTNPWTMTPGNATSLGWHNDGTTDYTVSRGNNVNAYEDRANANAPGLNAVSTTIPDPLNFNFPPNYTVAPTTAAFQQFAITNLFYWNNILHDISYLYGFTEVAGNFQTSNQGRGGLGNDYVQAEAQDASGTNNANFATPVDGLRPRMQMFLWSGTPQLDGDLDNGVILHEGSHGISNRLTGGPSTTSCLGNQEQMGEGWSDYIGLMATQ
ncbi:MAG TPA: M36 family metallopeptidase, partial [Ferruginibacter sp.]|nr:M36 family metallopeptidase [Ferruginibacter sp.]